MRTRRTTSPFRGKPVRAVVPATRQSATADTPDMKEAPMRIAHHTWEFPPTIVGGLGTYSQCITTALADLGHDVHVWSPDQVGWPKTVVPVPHPRVHERRLPLFDITGVFPHLLNDDLRNWGGYLSDLITFNLQATGETRLTEGLDVIAVQDWLSAIAGLSLAKDRKVPVVFHIHSAEWGRQPGGGGSASVRNFEASMAHHADAVVTVSHAMREDLIAHGWDAGKIHTVWNGVDPKRYRPGIATTAETDALRARYGIPNGVPVILYVGRLVPEKGVLPMIEAVPSVLASNPDAHLVVLGAGQMEGPMRTRIADLGVSGQVHMRAELVSEHERIVHFEMCDVGLFPSTYEPFGIVTLEAMAIGKACVAGARGVVGFRDQVVPSGDVQTGLHVDGGNPTDIAWGLNEALSDRHRLANWGANGRARVLAEFTWEIAAKKTAEIYRAVAVKNR